MRILYKDMYVAWRERDKETRFRVCSLFRISAGCFYGTTFTWYHDTTFEANVECNPVFSSRRVER